MLEERITAGVYDEIALTQVWVALHAKFVAIWQPADQCCGERAKANARQHWFIDARVDRDFSSAIRVSSYTRSHGGRNLREGGWAADTYQCDTRKASDLSH